jgi:hypothetical protein
MTLLNEWTREEVRVRPYRIPVGAEHGTRQHPQVRCGRVQGVIKNYRDLVSENYNLLLMAKKFNNFQNTLLVS